MSEDEPPQRVRWDSTEAIIVSIAILAVPAGLSLLATGSLDLVFKAGWAFAATALVLLVLLAINWLRAPAALDAEREAEIASLKELIAQQDPEQ